MSRETWINLFILAALMVVVGWPVFAPTAAGPTSHDKRIAGAVDAFFQGCGPGPVSLDVHSEDGYRKVTLECSR